MLDTDAARNYADKANEIVSLQAIRHCPDRRLELESMAPHLASMLTELVNELSRVYLVLNGRDEESKTYTDLDREVLEVVSKFHRSKMQDICRIIGSDVKSRQVEESLRHLQYQCDVSYQRRGIDTGWSVI